MRQLDGALTAAISLGLMIAPCQPAFSQEPAQAQQPQVDASAPTQAPAPASSTAGQGTTDSAAATKTYTVPPGTKVLLQLRSGINTKSAKPGDSIYLASTFPVVVGNRVLIPAGVQPGSQVPVVLQVGTAASGSGVFIAVSGH